MNKYEQANLEAEYNKRKELLSDQHLSKLFEMATDCSKQTAEEIREVLITVILDENIDLKSMDY
jgi:hypothetical protein